MFRVSKHILGVLAFLSLTVSFAQAQDQEAEHAFAKEFLATIQPRSFDNHREYCGFFAYNKKNEIVAIKPRPGDEASCTAYWPRASLEVFASYHTHGGWDPEYDSEMPSVDDVTSDMSDEINGYIATPGGRLWHVDGKTGFSRQICGRGCLPMDPDFQREPRGSVPKSISLERLRHRQNE